jgi:phosphoribosylanthranilate isomerase
MAAARIKFCGMTRLEDATAAVEAGAWAVGVILWPGSKRACSLDEAARIAGALRRRAEVCGVFVNPTLDEVVGSVEAAGLTMVQLHGDEGPTFCDAVAHRTGAKVMKAARVRGRADLQAVQAFSRVDFHLLDAHVEGVRGGSGQTWDWALLQGRRSRVPLVVSGGLTPANVGEAIAATHPFAVDVASGVESSPGIKDHDALHAFAAAVAEANAAAATAGASAA